MLINIFYICHQISALARSFKFLTSSDSSTPQKGKTVQAHTLNPVTQRHIDLTKTSIIGLTLSQARLCDFVLLKKIIIKVMIFNWVSLLLYRKCQCQLDDGHNSVENIAKQIAIAFISLDDGWVQWRIFNVPTGAF